MFPRTVAAGLCALLGVGDAWAKSLLPPSSTASSRAAAPRNDASCAAFGPGFQKIPGSDTCVKLGGAVRVEMGVNAASSSFFPSGR